MDLTRATINAWEMGISYPNAQSLIMFSRYFKVSVDYLLGMSDNETLDISSLTDKEKRMVCDMVKHLADLKKSKKTPRRESFYFSLIFKIKGIKTARTAVLMIASGSIYPPL